MHYLKINNSNKLKLIITYSICYIFYIKYNPLNMSHIQIYNSSFNIYNSIIILSIKYSIFNLHIIY